MALAQNPVKIQQLPNELVEHILVQVVVMEVKGLRLAKTVWNQKADLVIKRLRTVCSHWTNLISSTIFQIEVHRILDGLAEPTIRLEVLEEIRLPVGTLKATTWRNDLLLLGFGDDDEDTINFYSRDNLALVKEIVSLPGKNPIDIAASNTSNCVYVLNSEPHCRSVLRITRAHHNYFISPFISTVPFSVSSIHVTTDGRLLLLSVKQGQESSSVSIYCKRGLLNSKIFIGEDKVALLDGDSVLEKANGNLVLVSVNRECQTCLTEINGNGIIVSHFISLLGVGGSVNFADIHGRIIIGEKNRVQVVDSELNGLTIVHPPGNSPFLDFVRFWRERNEIVLIQSSGYATTTVSIVRVLEEP